MTDIYQPLDPRPNACEITDMSDLRSVEIGITMSTFSIKEIKSLAIDPQTGIIGEIDFSNPRLAAQFIAGDQFIKVNDEIPTTFVHLSKLLAAPGEIHMIVKRRAFVTPPEVLRVQAGMAALNLSHQKKFAYQVVTCKKMPYDLFVTNSFGFTAESVTVSRGVKKFIVAEINTNTAAEKYFSVGDTLIDFRGLPVLNDGSILKQFNTTFQTVGEIDVLIERPVGLKNRESIASLIKSHLSKHDTPAMCDEVTKIGLSAARYHNMFWRRMVPVSIMKKPGDKSPINIPEEKTAQTPTKKTKGSKEERGKTRGSQEARTITKDEGMRKKSKTSKKTKPNKKSRNKKSLKKKRGKSVEGGRTRDFSEEASYEQTNDQTREATKEGDESSNNRVKIVGAKSYQEITSDVDPKVELESIGLRYADDFEDENTQDDEEQKKMKLARKALQPIKKGIFSGFSLFKKQEKEKEK